MACAVEVFLTMNQLININTSMTITMKSLLTVLACASSVCSPAQGLPLKPQQLEYPDNEPAPCFPLPTDRQLKWHDLEFYAFYHYGMNTYTDKEWGFGDEQPSTFAPTKAPNPKQWLEACKAAGMKGGIAVVKHHDGFCLWPTATTDHNCTNSSNKYAKATNIPRDFAKAARELDMKYGFYVSPWDRNSALYGTDKYVTDVFMKQCDELAKFGSDQFEMWFDGANGGDGYYGGANCTRSVDASTYYDIPNLRDYVHSIAPDCVMWGVGEEARWIGNESGFAGETDWCMMDRGHMSEESSRNCGQENGWIWLPGESDAKATDSGWFWHPTQKELSAERLFQMYLETVGRNANLILNVPPDRSGELPASSVKMLKDMGKLLNDRLGKDLALKASSIVSSDTRANGARRTYDAKNMIDANPDTYWAPNDDVTAASVVMSWDKPQDMRYVTLQEYIAKGQRVKGFKIETSMDGENWTVQAPEIAQTTVGYKRIIPLNGSTAQSYTEPVKAKYLRVSITDSRACPLINNISVF